MLAAGLWSTIRPLSSHGGRDRVVVVPSVSPAAVRALAACPEFWPSRFGTVTVVDSTVAVASMSPVMLTVQSGLVPAQAPLQLTNWLPGNGRIRRWMEVPLTTEPNVQMLELQGVD